MPGYELIGTEEKAEVDAVMQTGVLARYGFEQIRNGSWKARDLEQALCNTIGVGYAQLVNNGTAALSTALAALNIGAGHEVIMPVFSDVACFEAIIGIGAIPVLADVDESLTIKPEVLKEMVTDKTRAVIAVHTAGSICNIEAIKTFCTEHKLLLIEDASQAIGASLNGRQAGSYGDIACFSFDAYNTITCGEGGAVITNDANLYKLCNEYTDHGHDHLGTTRSEDGHKYIGTNYRISELHAAVGLAQLKKLPEIVKKQKQLHSVLKQELSAVPGLSFRQAPGADADNCGYVTVLLNTEEQTRTAALALKTAGIPHMYWYENKWHYVHKWEHFKNGSWMNRLYNDQKTRILQHSNLAFPMSDVIMSRCLSFAVSLKWNDGDAGQRGKQIAKILNDLKQA